MQASEKINEIYKFKPNYVIEAIKIALNESTACSEYSEINTTTFIFLYKDGSQLTIDTRGHVKSTGTDIEYWVY